MARTTIAVDTTTRDKLARIAEGKGGSLDETLRALIFEYECHEALRRLDADPEALEDYQRESLEWAELDVQVIE